MAELWGKTLTRAELLRRTGSGGQLFGIRPFAFTAGPESLLRGFEINTGGGLVLTVDESKALDLFQLSWRGVNLGFVSKAGLHAPWLCDENGMSYRRCLGAGFLYTAGLSNVGMFCEDGEDYHYAHGAVKNVPAEHVCSRESWQGDECTLSLEGDVREAAFFGRNLLLHRVISANVGARSFRIRDTIENQDFSPAQLMLLYHMNLGYPLLDEGTELLARTRSTEPMSEHTRTDRDWRVMNAPSDGNEEYLYAHTPCADESGIMSAAVFNDRLGFGLEIRYPVRYLRYLIEWKCMKSGDYALGLLPSTCKPVGRLRAAREDQFTTLAPLEKIELELEIRILESRRELEQP
jgi:hypothetical protein